jgi:membrane dipeptidase
LVSKDLVSAICLTVPHSSADFTATCKSIGGLWRQAVASGSALRIALKVEDITTAKADCKFALILTFQHWEPIGNSLDAMQVFHRLGLRVAQLAYNDMSHAAAGCLEGDYGLTRFGRRAVAEMNRLGILVDLSHCNDRTCLEAAHASSKPVVLSHANPHAKGPNPRNKSDAVIKAVAASGGVIGLSPWGPLSWRGPGSPRPSLQDYLDKVAYVADMVGVDHLSFGSDTSVDGSLDAAGTQLQAVFFPEVVADYDREIGRTMPIRYTECFTSPRELPLVVDGLLKSGLSRQDVEKYLGLNLLRVLSQVMG